jgi:ATP-binding cassette subfamily B protein
VAARHLFVGAGAHAPEAVMSSQETKKRNVFITSLAYVFSHWRRQPVLAALTCAAMLTATLAELAMPLIAGRLVDLVAAEGERDVSTALSLVALLAAVALAGVGFRHLSFLGIIRFTLKMMHAAASETFARVQRLSADWHANNFAGSTVRKITRGMWAIDQMNDTIIIAFLPSFIVLSGATLLFALRWPLVGLAILLGALVYITFLITTALKIMAPAATLTNRWDTKLGGVIADSISCNPVVKGYGGEAREDRRVVQVLDKWRKRSARLWTFGTNLGSIQLVMLASLRAGVVALAILLWGAGEAGPGDITFVLTAYAVIDGYLREMGVHVRNTQRAVNDMEDLVAFQREPMGVADRPDAKPMRINRGEIRFDDVGFHYGDHAKPLYTDLDVTIPAGQKLALVGHSGSGKTTFVKLVQRLYDVTSGKIAIDGVDVRSVTQTSLRQAIAVVQQDPVLFHRTLAENIAYGRPNATEAEIIAAAKRANAHDFILRLERGYATLVGERGVKLSGGERQRVAIARAFLADAPILILDEATSSLDAESEAAVQQAIERLMQNRTTIVIAHRLSTVRAMDRLIVFDKGRIVEDGDHDRLMRLDAGIYRRLFERQVRAMADELAV